MVNKKGIAIGGGFIVVCVIVSFIYFFTIDSPNKTFIDTNSNTIKVAMKENYNPEKNPSGFDSLENVNTANLIGVNTTQTLTNDYIKITQELKKDGDLFVGKDGIITLVVGGMEHELSIQSSLVSHFSLSNGNNLLTGSFESEFKDLKDNLLPTTISFVSIVETREQFLYVTIGTIEAGPVVLAYGDDNFRTKEIQDIVWGLANFE